MNYTLHQLQVYLTVVEKQSITRAAEALHLTQPAVTIQLRKFESQFDIPLIDRIGKSLYITDFGKEIAQIAQKVVDTAFAIENRTTEYKGLLTGKLKIASASTGKYVIPYFISDFLERHPGVDLILDVTNKTYVIESVAQNQVDFAVVSTLPEHLNLQEEELIDNELYLVGSSGDFKEGKPLIFRESGSATRAAMEKYFSKGKMKVRKRFELQSNEAVKQAVMAGLGYSLLPLIGIKHELDQGRLQIIPRKDLPVRSKWRLVRLTEKTMTPVAEAFLVFIQENKSELIERWF